MTWRILEGDCIEQMQAMEPASVDAVVTDPPYGLEFMGKEWDRLAPTTGREGLRPDAGSTAPVKSTFKDGVGTRMGAPRKNPRCRLCSRLRFDHAPRRCNCDSPDWDTRTAEYARVIGSAASSPLRAEPSSTRSPAQARRGSPRFVRGSRSSGSSGSRRTWRSPVPGSRVTRRCSTSRTRVAREPIPRPPARAVSHLDRNHDVRTRMKHGALNMPSVRPRSEPPEAPACPRPGDDLEDPRRRARAIRREPIQPALVLRPAHRPGHASWNRPASHGAKDRRPHFVAGESRTPVDVLIPALPRPPSRFLRCVRRSGGAHRHDQDDAKDQTRSWDRPNASGRNRASQVAACGVNLLRRESRIDLMPRTRNRVCGEKLRRTKQQAKDAAKYQRRAFHARVYAYSCPFAEAGSPHWHVGHRGPGQKGKA